MAFGFWLEAHLGGVLPTGGVRDSTRPVHAQLVPWDLHSGFSGAPSPPDNVSSSEPCTHASAACPKFRSLTVLKVWICNHQQNSTSEELKLTSRFCWFVALQFLHRAGFEVIFLFCLDCYTCSCPCWSIPFASYKQLPKELSRA